ncbi:MAG: phosphonate ABC transporter, permease protein PhnE [Candidatus Izemoplasmatales bacterium]|jgi:phosphonate transport system permease protein|nr:phosphonate ABC transporter, permease protein PhnE [Candidatus Izemoplasmatales bacterium]NLF48995.1 phosphonate ABC transporter, permease protein PhnE [Acholeplasmataceae bacterium]MDD4355016.1 phosphonate ABC transporter, permease protein PhnE [Candidatus Izemoplasmatales bacterium]MDD4988282.1 phosphonate ABC transporter, permease protein PhnE [Candidatus Izemoplasmatales bacterium]MDD5602181.1 phosphonate ABC transporter, permease protein PhnE [Candidatus Izemoplasmatales bacterium]
MTKFTLENGKTVTKPFNKIWIIVGVVILLLYLFSLLIPVNLGLIQLSELKVILQKMFSPKGTRTWGDYFGYLLTLQEPLVDTLSMSFAGTLIGSLMAIPLAVLSAKNIVKKAYIYLPARTIMNLFRTIPAMVLALIAVFFVGIGVLSGIIAITLFTFSIMSKMLYEVIETIDMNPVEALESTGASKIESLRYAVMPQVTPIFLSYLIYIFEINVRSSTILGYVGAGGIGMIIKDNILYNYDRVGASIILMFFVILVVQLFSSFARGRLQ